MRTKELNVMPHGLAVERVQHGVPSAVCSARTPVCLTALAEVKGLAAKCALVDEAILCSAEGQAVVLQLAHGGGRLTAHVLNGILQTRVELMRKNSDRKNLHGALIENMGP